MTEQEWMASDDPGPMLEFLRGRASVRKFRLYLCESYRRIPSERLPGKIRKAILVIERYAEGLASRKELLDARSRAWESVTKFGEQTCRSRSAATSEDLLHHARLAAIARGTSPDDGVIYLAGPQLLSVTERPHQVGLFHDIFGNPFRPVTVDPACLTSTVVSLASTIYDDRAFDRLPILADALEDAGCTHDEILNHCRQPGEHARGCWVLDLLLGKS